FVILSGYDSRLAGRSPAGPRRALHTERAPRFIHDGLVDGRVPVFGRESLDRAARHGPDERGDPLYARLRLGRPGPGARRHGRALVDHGREWTAARLGPGLRLTLADLGDVAFEGVGPRVGHHPARGLERGRVTG